MDSKNLKFFFVKLRLGIAAGIHGFFCSFPNNVKRDIPVGVMIHHVDRNMFNFYMGGFMDINTMEDVPVVFQAGIKEILPNQKNYCHAYR